jgi:hypothetical protein
MTYQRDPDRPIEPAPEDIVRRENIARRDEEIARANAEATNSRGFFPIVLTVMILLVGGYFVYSSVYPLSVIDTPRTTENTAPRTITPAPAPVTPAPAPAPVTPQTK